MIIIKHIRKKEIFSAFKQKYEHEILTNDHLIILNYANEFSVNSNTINEWIKYIKSDYSLNGWKTKKEIYYQKYLEAVKEIERLENESN